MAWLKASFLTSDTVAFRLEDKFTHGRATDGRSFVASVGRDVHRRPFVSRHFVDLAPPSPREFLYINDLLLSGDSIKRRQCEHGS
jgi:hypothetical protein